MGQLSRMRQSNRRKHRGAARPDPFNKPVSGTHGRTTTVLVKNGEVTAPMSDAEVRDILVHAMADAGADPAFVYAFQKTGVYLCEENEKRHSKEKLKAFESAVDEYFEALKGPRQ